MSKSQLLPVPAIARTGLLLALAALAANPIPLRAEYHGFNTAGGSDGVVQDVRWPYWAQTTYNAIYS